MNIQNTIRLAFVLSNSQASKFKTNLKKIVKIILMDHYPKSLNSYEISRYIKDAYSLDFVYKEIDNTIGKDKSFIVQKKNELNYYSLVPGIYQKLIAKNNNNNLISILDRYISENDVGMDIDKLEDIILKFFYNTFNNDVQTLLKLLDKNSDIEDNTIEIEEFNSDEELIINNFLNWDNKDKNEFILNMVTSCYDYCMLTIKKDDRSYSNVFNNKIFYLDSNVIFRLAGFNKKERQNVMQAFINKCMDAGIEIRYTNFTKAEIKSTIESQVRCLSKTFAAQNPISTEAFSLLDSRYSSFDFYEKYYEWTKDPCNEAGDYKSFEQYLHKEVEKCCQKFKMDVFEDFDVVNNQIEFRKRCVAFSKMKEENYRKTNSSAIKTDINNYYYILSKNSNGQANNFTELNYYFITADHCLVEWTQNIRPGSIPTFVLPSVWYSILLKYKGRTENDFEAFCKFLNIRIAPEKDELYTDKTVMLAKVLEISESKDIKEEIIYDINSKLSDFSKDDNPLEFANASIESIVQKHIDQAVNKVKSDTEKQINELNSKFENQKDSIFIQGRDEGYHIGIDKGAEDAKNKFIEKRVAEIVKRNNAISVISAIIFGIVILYILISLIIKSIFNSDNSNDFINWINNNSNVTTVVGFIFDLLVGIVFYIGKKTQFLSTSQEVIRKQVEKKYKK